MNSVDIYVFKHSILKFINDADIPSEVKRLVLKEIYDEVQTKALEDMKKELETKGVTENAESVSD